MLLEKKDFPIAKILNEQLHFNAMLNEALIPDFLKGLGFECELFEINETYSNEEARKHIFYDEMIIFRVNIDIIEGVNSKDFGALIFLKIGNLFNNSNRKKKVVFSITLVEKANHSVDAFILCKRTDFVNSKINNDYIVSIFDLACNNKKDYIIPELSSLKDVYIKILNEKMIYAYASNYCLHFDKENINIDICATLSDKNKSEKKAGNNLLFSNELIYVSLPMNNNIAKNKTKEDIAKIAKVMVDNFFIEKHSTSFYIHEDKNSNIFVLFIYKMEKKLTQKLDPRYILTTFSLVGFKLTEDKASVIKNNILGACDEKYEKLLTKNLSRGIEPQIEALMRRFVLLNDVRLEKSDTTQSKMLTFDNFQEFNTFSLENKNNIIYSGLKYVFLLKISPSREEAAKNKIRDIFKLVLAKDLQVQMSPDLNGGHNVFILSNQPLNKIIGSDYKNIMTPNTPSLNNNEYTCIRASYVVLVNN